MIVIIVASRLPLSFDPSHTASRFFLSCFAQIGRRMAGQNCCLVFHACLSVLRRMTSSTSFFDEAPPAALVPLQHDQRWEQ